MFAQRFVTANPREIQPQGYLTPHSHNNLPMLSGEDDLYTEKLYPTTNMSTRTWFLGDPNIYTALLYSGPAPKQLYFDGNPGTNVGTLANMKNQLDWYIVAPTAISVYSSDNPSSLYSLWTTNWDHIPYSNHFSKRQLKKLRVIYHPGRNMAYEYPMNPTRTINYYHMATRRWNVQQVDTLSSAVNVMDLQSWESVTIEERWEGALSVMSEFFEALHLFTVEAPALGSYVSWCPFDLGWGRHLIQPISVEVGGEAMDIYEIRESWHTRDGSYLDQPVTFKFRLVRGQVLAGTAILAEGY